MPQSTEKGTGGDLASPAAIAPPTPAPPALDFQTGFTPVSGNFLQGQNGKERLAWASYAPRLADVSLSGGAGWNPFANRAHRDRHAASAIAAEHFVSDPTLRAICETIVTNAVGEGLVLTSRVDPALTGMTPEEAKSVAHQIESAWARYASNPLECDVSGRYSVYEIVEQAITSWLLSGEYLCALDVERAPGATFLTKACLLDPRMIGGDVTKTADDGGIFQGVEFNSRGRFVALHLRRVALGSTYQTGAVKRVPVFTRWGRKKLAFYLETLFPGQVRGVSPLIASLTPAREKNFLNDLSVTAQALSNAFAVVVESDMPAPVALQGLETHPEPVNDRNAIAEALISLREAWYGGPDGAKIRADAGQVVHMAPGDKLQFVQSPKQGADYSAFQKALTQSAARAAGVSTPDVSGFWGDSNFAASRLEAALPHRLTLRRRRSVAARLMQDIFEAWLEEAIAIGVVKLPRHAEHFWDAREGYVQTKWRGAGIISSDRKKDADAISLELSNHLISLEDALAERGVDLEAHIAQLKMEKQLLEEAGLHPAYATQTQIRVTTDEQENDDPAADSKPKGFNQ